MDHVTSRGETPQHVYAVETGPKVTEVFTPILADHMVELGESGIPSWTGIAHLLQQIACGAVPVGHFAIGLRSRVPLIRAVAKDALLTEDGVAFLTGHQHSLLKYVTGARKPTKQSLKVFGKTTCSLE